MKLSHIILVIALSAATAFGVTKYAAPAATTTPTKETAFERVIRTGTIRCAYALAGKPRFIPDPNTGKLAGSDVEIMEEIGRVLNLKIEWVEEANYGAFFEKLNSGKQDVFCSTIWASPARAHKILLSAPIRFTPVYAYVRAGDTRFDNNLEGMNAEGVSFSVMENTTLDSVVRTTFPKATHHTLPLSAAPTDPIMDVIAGKSDALVFDESNVNAYNQKNPDKQLRRVPSVNPLRIYGEAYSVAVDEWKLREMINTAISELQNDGTINRILSKYEQEYGKVWRTQGPYIPAKE